MTDSESEIGKSMNFFFTVIRIFLYPDSEDKNIQVRGEQKYGVLDRGEI